MKSKMKEPQIIRAPSGDEMVVITRAEYDALLDAASYDEDDEDVAIYDARKAELSAGRDSPLPAAVSDLILKGDSLPRALRRWRGLTQLELAAKAEVSQGYVSDIESRRRTGAPETLQRLAKALNVPMQWME
jgi:ribosome-binding protein aMBF1 (putative translation factor)